ncbi:hypothetical protein RJ639_008077 [Escallonia herrerae]|uniref:Pectinesterase inhibitor domain-containing protein n=1 Tax=Escallonia herrerae TaxID=1293975 RepID=A0AA88VQQ5_9ASTE|nr:hypothetical protein RJ639_008077 [Escallonia herrerae]
MASFGTLSMFLSFLIVLVCIAPTSLGRSHTEGELWYLCSKTEHPWQCLKLLKSADIRYSRRNLNDITKVLIDITYNKGKEIHDTLNSLANEASDSRIRRRFISCSKNYNDALRDLGIAKRNLLNGNYKVIPVEVNDILQEVKGCYDYFTRASRDRYRLKEKSEDFKLLCSILKQAVLLIYSNDYFMKKKPKPEAAPPAPPPEEPAPAGEPYGPYISGLDQVSQIRRLKHIELTHKRTMRMTFRKPMEDYGDDYSYSYEYPYHGYPMHGGAYGQPLAHRSMLPGPPAPMGICIWGHHHHHHHHHHQGICIWGHHHHTTMVNQGLYLLTSMVRHTLISTVTLMDCHLRVILIRAIHLATSSMMGTPTIAQ